jgi:hypothetical protein
MKCRASCWRPAGAVGVVTGAAIFNSQGRGGLADVRVDHPRDVSDGELRERATAQLARFLRLHSAPIRLSPPGRTPHRLPLPRRVPHRLSPRCRTPPRVVPPPLRAILLWRRSTDGATTRWTMPRSDDLRGVSNVLVGAGLVIVQSGFCDNNVATALDPATGAVLWRTDRACRSTRQRLWRTGLGCPRHCHHALIAGGGRSRPPRVKQSGLPRLVVPLLPSPNRRWWCGRRLPAWSACWIASRVRSSGR